MDQKKLRYDLKLELSKLPREQVVWFAARSALRTLPFLAHKGEKFPFFKNEEETRVLAIFRSINASFAMTDRLILTTANVAGFAVDAANAARAARKDTHATFVTDAASLAAFAAFAAANTVDATCEATANFAASAASEIYHAYYSSDYTTAYLISTAIYADLACIKKGTNVQWPDLWHGCPPPNWNLLVEYLLLGLHRLGLDYWSEEFRSWESGRFDRGKVERCLFMPKTTIEAGSKAMLVYLQAEQLVLMAESRVVFLGEGEAGKTSLIRRLFGEEIRGDELATPCVEIRQRSENIDGREIRVHYWDFGGQVIMHATHQFFLREKSVYVVVLDIRRSDSLEYWLDHVRVFASGAPTIIVLNKVDSLPTGMATRPPFDLNKIRRRYPFVVDAVFLLSCKTVEGVEAFVSAFKECIAKNHILRADMPKKWFQVKEALADENKDFIPRDRFDDICHSNDVYGDDIDTALRVLDILGVAIHFPSLRQNDVVLNPEWITKSIYFIIWASEGRHLNGKLDETTLKSLFAEARENIELDVNVPDEKCKFLLDLMTEFKLAFQGCKREGQYCVPMLAPTDEPPHDVSRQGGLKFAFSLPFLPPGLFYRFIAESGNELFDDLIWKTGAILVHGGTRVLVEYSDYQRSITYIAHGPDAGIYLTTLRQKLMQILGESYKDLTFNPYIIKPNGEQIDWRDIVERFAREKWDAKAYSGGIEYKIADLLQEYFGGVFDNFLQSLKSEIGLLFEKNREVIVMVNNINKNDNSSTNTVTSTNNIRQDISITVSAEIQSLLHVDSDLEMVKELLDDFKADKPEEAAEHENTLIQLYRDIERLRKDISDLKAISETEEAEKKPIMGRIKERWDNFSERAKQCYYVTGMGDKIAKSAVWIGAIDWDKWLSKLP